MTDDLVIRLPRRLGRRLGQREWHISLNENDTLEQVFMRLAEECHPSFGDLLTSETARPQWVESIILNGRLVVLPDDLQLGVERGDQLFIFEPLGGG